MLSRAAVDGPPDGTGSLADALSRRYPRLQVVHRPAKAGLGAAYLDTLKQGFTVTEMPIVFTARARGTSKMSRAIVAEALVQVPRTRREERRRAARVDLRGR